jgi:phage terminase small subunit
MTTLNARQRAFAESYVVDFNATRAAESAGYSARTARQMGAENLTKLYIREEIGRLLKRRSSAIGISVEQRINDLRLMLEADIATAFDENGWIKPMSEIPPELRILLIASLKAREVHSPNGKIVRRSFSIRFVDRTPLLEELGRLLGAW